MDITKLSFSKTNTLGLILVGDIRCLFDFHGCLFMMQMFHLLDICYQISTGCKLWNQQKWDINPCTKKNWLWVLMILWSNERFSILSQNTYILRIFFFLYFMISLCHLRKRIWSGSWITMCRDVHTLEINPLSSCFCVGFYNIQDQTGPAQPRLWYNNEPQRSSRRQPHCLRSQSFPPRLFLIGWLTKKIFDDIYCVYNDDILYWLKVGGWGRYEKCPKHILFPPLCSPTSE